MNYWDYVISLFRKKIGIKWELPYLWTLIHSIQGLRSIILDEFSEEFLGSDEENDEIRVGFLLKGNDDGWYWLLLDSQFEKVSRGENNTVGEDDCISVFKDTPIPEGGGMIGALTSQGLFDDKKGHGGLFFPPDKSLVATQGEYPSKLLECENEVWPDDEFVLEFFMGCLTISEDSLVFDSDINSLHECSWNGNNIALALIVSAGTEGVSPVDVFDADISVSTFRRFFEEFLDHYSKRLRITSEALERSVVASIMSRNMSHNIGSHVLASPDLLKEGLVDRVKKTLSSAIRSSSQEDIEDGMRELKAAVEKELETGRREVQLLHNFLQQRMDFIAQVVTYTPSWGEPMFFLEDLVRGFAGQKLLLGFLVKDQGYGKDEIVLKVHYEGKTKELRVGEEGSPQREAEGEFSGDDALEDFLVAIPGGAIGAHAFYDILENVMRNSAKYGQKDNGEMELHLDIERDEERYRVTLWDNLSPQSAPDGNGKDPVGTVESHLVQPLVDPRTGSADIEGRGIHEIKECARILAHLHGDTTEWQFEVKSDGRIRNLPVKALSYSKKEQTQYLAYQFYLQNPHLVGIAFPDGRTHASLAEESGAKAAGLFSYAGEEDGSGVLDSLIEYAHQFGIIWMPEAAEKREEVLDFIAEHHHTLPYRLLLATSKREDIKEALREQKDIPARRVHLCGKEDLNDILSRADQEQSRKHWARAVIEVYELWLRQFKPLQNENDEKWQIAILLERGEEHPSFERWRTGLDGFDSDVVDMHVGQFQESGNDGKVFEMQISTAEISSKECLAEEIAENPQRFIIFDNHGAGLETLDHISDCAPNEQRPKLACYHEAGLKEAFKIYQSLEFPPQDTFGVMYFVLGLVESALTNVLVIDERVAEATFTEQDGLETPYHLLETLRNTGIYPIYSLWTGEDEDSSTRTFVSDAIEKTNKKVVEREGVDRGLHSEEGLHIYRESDKFVKRQDVINADSFIDSEDLNKEEYKSKNKYESIDTIIIHQGVLDRLANFKPPRWNRDEDIQALFRLSPSVIVTSGRGRNLREETTQDTIPFIEFSTVRETTYADISKYHLVRALLSVVGKRS